MTANGHFCLGFFSKEIWKENFRHQFYTKARERFDALLKSSYDDHDAWAEVHVQSLFNPKHLENGAQTCYVGEYLLSLFKKKLGYNNGLILFSHTVIKHKVAVDLLSELIQEDRVKKIYFTVLDENSYILPSESRKEKYSVLVKEIQQHKIHISEFQQRIQKSGYTYNILFEIVKYK